MNRNLSKLVLHLATILLLATTLLASQTAAQGSAQSATEPPSLPAKPVPGEGAAGEWRGVLEVGAMTLRLALHVEEKDDGGLGAILDSVDQGAKIPVDTVVFERGTLRLALHAIGASYQGTLNADGSALEGVWSQGGRELPLTFHRLE